MIKYGGIGISHIYKKVPLKLLLGIAHFVSQTLFLIFGEENMVKLQNTLLQKFFTPTTSIKIKIKIKNREIFIWKLLAPNIRKHLS